MCNIAGYVGTKQAAPILIDMIRKQEGLNAGFYTGIATVHEGKIYYAKLAGDLEHLLENTEAAALPGTAGIIHSRTQSGGGDEWAHPFVGQRKDGRIETAYVANGHAGRFAAGREEAAKLAERLIENGYPMNAQLILEEQRYQTLSDGTSVHMSDVMCQLILSHLDRLKDGALAMEEAFCEMPGEIVGLMLEAAKGDRIHFSRVNMPMNVGFASHGAYLASAAMCFPEDAGEVIGLPSCSFGSVYKNSLSVKPYRKAPVKVVEADAFIQAEAYRLICEILKKEPRTVPELGQMIRHLFPEDSCYGLNMLIYEVLYSLNRQGLLQICVSRLPGIREGLSAPLFRLSLA